MNFLSQLLKNFAVITAIALGGTALSMAFGWLVAKLTSNREWGWATAVVLLLLLAAATGFTLTTFHQHGAH